MTQQWGCGAVASGAASSRRARRGTESEAPELPSRPSTTFLFLSCKGVLHPLGCLAAFGVSHHRDQQCV